MRESFRKFHIIDIDKRNYRDKPSATSQKVGKQKSVKSLEDNAKKAETKAIPGQEGYDPDDASDLQSQVEAADPAAQLEQNEIMNLLLSAIKNLPEEYRDVANDNLILHMEPQEIAVNRSLKIEDVINLIESGLGILKENPKLKELMPQKSK